MNIKKTIINALATSFLCVGSISALASETPFKVAIIENALGSDDIISGNYNKFIKNLPSNKPINSAFESNMSLCAAYIKTAEYDKSESACTAAIKTLKLIDLPIKKSLYLKALSFSNRGVSRYLNNDIAGSIDDFTTAMLVDVNTITKSNLTLAKHGLLKEKEQNSFTLSE